MTDTTALLSAIVLAVLGGDLFLKGVIGTADWLRLPPLLIATTLSAAATSSPELSVSVMAALDGRPGIGLGDALGSNVVNIALIMGAGLLFGAMDVRFSDVRRDFILALFVPPVTWLLALDGTLSRADGALLLLLFGLWLTLGAKDALAHHRRMPPTEAAPPSLAHPLLHALVGLACLILAGRLFVSGASGIAATLGLSGYVIGATLVAIGTSLPELVTMLMARWRGHDEVGLGTVLGSNLFNGLAIVGVAAAIHPVTLNRADIGIVLAVGLLTMLLVLPRKNRLGRQRGIWLGLIYVAFVTLTLSQSPSA